jgi:hypothetical protein
MKELLLRLKVNPLLNNTTMVAEDQVERKLAIKERDLIQMAVQEISITHQAKF